MGTIADKLEYIASNEERVYQHGLDRGYGNGYDDGYSGGYSECYDAFWDSAQDYGNRTNYEYAFVYDTWNDETFKPKYPLKPVGSCRYMFRFSKIVDLAECLRRGGLTEIDFSKATKVDYCFRDSTIKRLPKIIVGDNTQMNGMLAYSDSVEVIEELYLPPTYDKLYAHVYLMNNLRECNISGLITCNISFANSAQLTTEDAINTILHLKDFSFEEENMYKYTITFHADVWARLDALGNASPIEDTWRNWCIDMGWLTA